MRSVAAARQQASTEVTDTWKDAAKNVDSAAANVDGSFKDLNDASVRAVETSIVIVVVCRLAGD